MVEGLVNFSAHQRVFETLKAPFAARANLQKSCVSTWPPRMGGVKCWVHFPQSDSSDFEVALYTVIVNTVADDIFSTVRHFTAVCFYAHPFGKLFLH